MLRRSLRLFKLVAVAAVTACSSASEPVAPFTHDVEFEVTSETYFALGAVPSCPLSSGDTYCTAWRDASGGFSGALRLASPYELTINGVTYAADALKTDSTTVTFYRTSEYRNCDAIVGLTAVGSGGKLHGTWIQETACHGQYRAGTFTVR